MFFLNFIRGFPMKNVSQKNLIMKKSFCSLSVFKFWIMYLKVGFYKISNGAYFKTRYFQKATKLDAVITSIY